MAVTAICVFFLLLGLCGMTGTLVWAIRRGNNNRVTRLFAACQISIILWLVSQLLILFSEVRYQYWISYIIGNIGIGLFAPLWLGFTYEFSGVKKLKKLIYCIIPIISCSAVFTVISNPLHNMYYASFDVHKVEYGPLFYIYQAVYYICIIAGITIMSLKFAKEKRQINRQAVLLILSAAVPLSVNTLTLFRIIRSRIELTPLFFAFSSIMVLLAVGRYDLLNINSIAMRDTVDSMDIGMAVFNSSGNITYSNKAVEKMIDMDGVSDITGFMSCLTDEKEDISSGEFHVNGSYLALERSVCSNKKGSAISTVATLNDVTKFHKLAAAEKKLSIEHERNRIAQEMHDSAGHTFTMISSLAKIANFELNKNEPDIGAVLRSLNEIDGLSRSGVTQLRCSINNLREDTFMNTVTQAIQTVVDAVRGVEVDFCTQGDEDERYSFCIREIYDNVRETITNAMRYSEASRIDIIAKFTGSSLEVYILDNGKGCRNIKENNGLKGIRQRTESLGGTVRFMSVEGEGFSTIIKIPVNNNVPQKKEV